MRFLSKRELFYLQKLHLSSFLWKLETHWHRTHLRAVWGVSLGLLPELPEWLRNLQTHTISKQTNTRTVQRGWDYIAHAVHEIFLDHVTKTPQKLNTLSHQTLKFHKLGNMRFYCLFYRRKHWFTPNWVTGSECKESKIAATLFS